MMPELSAIEQLDGILKWLVENAKQFWEIENIVNQPSYNHLRQSIDNQLLHLILERLVKDGKASVDESEREITYSYADSKMQKIWLYKVSFDGLVFYKQGGYARLLQLENDKLITLQQEREYQERQTKALKSLQLWIVIATVVAGLYYLVELLKYFRVLPAKFAP